MGLERILVIDDAAGVYIPRNFYERFDFPSWGLDISLYSELSDPDKEHYWDAWDDLLREAKHTDENGIEWSLDHDEGLFAVSGDNDDDA